MRDLINDLRRNLGLRILDLRKSGGLTQEELGEKAGLSYKFIGELERGEVNVSIDSLLKIAEALGIKIGDLFSMEKISVQKVFVKVLTEKRDSLARFSPQESQLIKEALRLLNRAFSKV